MIRMRQYVERQIVEALVKQAIRKGYEIQVDNGEDKHPWSTDCEAIMKNMFATDEEWLIMRKPDRSGGVYLVYGNEGWDVIADYSTSLEEIMSDANDVSEYWDGSGEFITFQQFKNERFEQNK